MERSGTAAVGDAAIQQRGNTSSAEQLQAALNLGGMTGGPS